MILTFLKKYEDIPINIHCATVNFESDNTKHLAVSGINTSSPDRNTKINNIASPSTNGKNSREYYAVETNTDSLLSPTSSTDDSKANHYKCYAVLLTRRKAVKKKQERINMMTNIISMRYESYIPASMRYDTQFLHWNCKTTALFVNLM